MIIYILLLIIIILIFLYLKKIKDNERQKMLIIKQKRFKETEDKNKKLRELKNNEDAKLNRSISVLCEDGIPRVYKESMYGLIIESKFVNDKKLKSYDFGNSRLKITAAFGKGEITQKLVYMGMFKEKWFSPKGKILNSTEILELRSLKKKKESEYYFRYGDILPRKRYPSPGPGVVIYLINEIYFINYFDRSPEFQLFNGELSGVKYKNGLPN
tara:strand:- start:281 stop:922 length:642 start_codon:yes stop_codon:yes gene_type:complete